MAEGARLLCLCGCGHHAAVPRAAFRHYADTRGLKGAEWLVCSRCGRRGPRVVASDAPAPPATIPDPAPRGIKQRAWTNADDRARKRLLDNLRG